MAFSFVVAAVLDLVAGIFMIVANKKIKKLIVAGQCDGDLPNNLKKSGGMVMAAGIIGLFTTLNDIYFVILIIIIGSGNCTFHTYCRNSIICISVLSIL